MKKLSFLLVVWMLGCGTVWAADLDDNYVAGQKWAQENGVIDDDFHSDDHSEDFDNGVRQYAIEQQHLQEQSD